MTSVMVRGGMKTVVVGGREAASLQSHLTGVTPTADWIIPCPLSHPMMLRGRIAPKVMHDSTQGNMQLAT